ncbi:MAG: LppP/LprE family lipoprotein [Rhodococcus sp.]|nr:LppP/LprE family lipoprotein [Rhodococcus sp. (in: high G+C Gram-positive bacteria)]
MRKVSQRVAGSSAAAITALALGLSACSITIDRSTRESEGTSTPAAAQPTTQQSGAGAPAQTTVASPDPDSCDVPGGESATISNAISRIAPPMAGGSWTVGQSTLDGCSDLSYVVLETAGGTASSPYQLLIFHDGVMQGTGTRCNLPYQSIVDSGEDYVTVNYRYIAGDEPNAAPQGSVNITYQWTGSGVEMIGTLPEAATGGQC